MNAKWIIGISIALSLATIAASVQAGEPDSALEAKATAIIKRDFRDKGIAKVDRLKQDDVQALCTKYLDAPPVDEMESQETALEKTIKWPSDGKYLGDWKAGEKLAQSGKGLTWSDKPDETPGGNCYNCHRISANEIAYGTIGTSLLHFRKNFAKPVNGKMRTEEEIQRYTYGHIYNAKAYNLCVNMPRFGQMGILTEAQIKDLVALLLDPESPVNK